MALVCTRVFAKEGKSKLMGPAHAWHIQRNGAVAPEQRALKAAEVRMLTRTCDRQKANVDLHLCKTKVNARASARRCERIAVRRQ
jgi:hypothetical protein